MDASCDAIVLFAHGSRDPLWAAPFVRMKEALAARRPETEVRLAFLELQQPGLPDTLDELAAAGRRRVVVAPLFLSQGAHLRRDLPALMKACESRHAGMQLRSLPALGDDAAVLEALTAWVDLQAGR